MTTPHRGELAELVARGVRRLAAAGLPSPGPDALRLAAFAAGVRSIVLAVPPPLPAGFAAAYDEALTRRAAHEPLQLIVGSAPFRYLELAVEAGVFIPRPETELVAGAAIDEARRILGRGQVPRVLDLCTGTGAIAVAVASEVRGSVVWAVDINPVAVALARRNALTAGIATGIDGSGEGGVTVLELDVRAVDLRPELTAGRGFDVVVSNPPYIPADATLPADVIGHDPAISLFGGGDDGLLVPAAVVARAIELLEEEGLFVMEHDDTQGASVRELVAATGQFRDVVTHQDLAGRDRFVTARRR